MKRDVPQDPKELKRAKLNGGCESIDHERAMELAARLLATGYAVVKVSEPTDLENIAAGFDECDQNAPELTPEAREQHQPSQLGAFGARGVSSSFHGPWPRGMRARLFKFLRLVYENVAATIGLPNIHVLPDRMCVRPPGQKMQKKNLHRDIPDVKDGARYITLQGFLNVGPKGNQYFLAVPGTHDAVGDASSGFCPVHNPHIYEKQATKIKIEPGHCIVFFPTIVHGVLGNTATGKLRRLFFAAGLTDSTEPLDPDVGSRLTSQAPLKLPSGQEPFLYAKLHPVNHREQLLAFSGRFNSACREEVVWKTGKCAGKHRIVSRVAPSLKKLQKAGVAKMYPSYTAEERAIYFPHPINPPLGVEHTAKLVKRKAAKAYLQLRMPKSAKTAHMSALEYAHHIMDPAKRAVQIDTELESKRLIEAARCLVNS